MSKNALVIKGANFATNKLTTVSFEEEIPCTALSLSESSKTVTSIVPFTLTATKTPANTTDALLWASSDTDVATVNNGTVTIVGVGTVTITATCGTQTATCSIDATEITVDADFDFFNLAKYSDTYLRSSNGLTYLSIYDKDSYGTKRGFRVGDSHTGCPIPLIKNVAKIKVNATGMYADVAHMFWCDQSRPASDDPTYADCCMLVEDDSSKSTTSGTVSLVYDVAEDADAFAARLRFYPAASADDDPYEFANNHNISCAFLAAAN